MKSISPRRLPCLLLSLACAPAYAANCPSPAQPDVNQPPLSHTSAQLIDGQIAAAASQMRISEDGNIINLQGDVEITTRTQRIRTDQAQIDKRRNAISAQGQLSVESQGITLSGHQAVLNENTQTLALEQAAFELRSSQRTLRGGAATVDQRSDHPLRMTEATLTSCPPGSNPAWQLELDQLQLDQGRERASATGVKLRFMGTPILYLPWINFSISDQRKSGFLYPKIGSDDINGLELELPFYWSILPQSDALFTALHMENRGTQLRSEWRYLAQNGDWQLNTESLDDAAFGDQRGAYNLRYRGQPSERWLGSINFTEISDNRYYSDLGRSLELTTLSHLEREAELSYRGKSQRFGVRLQSFQTIDDSIDKVDRPYSRLPQLTLSGPLYRSQWGLNFSHASELVYFDHDTLQTGSRLDLRPKIELPLEGQAWFFKPALQLWHTHYQLDDAERSSLSRSLVQSSLDAGVYLERNLDDGDIQTLEPRLFYLYTPHKDQSDIPVFDSTRLDFNFSQLFRNNRFSSADRVGDAEQITLALSSRRMQANTGAEYWRASLGQIFYFDQREVTLPEEPVETRASSDIVAEAAIRFTPQLSMTTTAQWDTTDSRARRDTLRLAYRGEDRRIFNFTHSLERGSHEQIEASAYWPLNDNWRIGSQWRYSLSEKYAQQTIAALEYDSCCWSASIFAQRLLSDPAETPRNSLNVQLTFKGLSDIGSDIDRSLERAILGYQRQTP